MSVYNPLCRRLLPRFLLYNEQVTPNLSLFQSDCTEASAVIICLGWGAGRSAEGRCRIWT